MIEKITTWLPNTPITFTFDEWLLLMKWRYWKNGIPAREFRKEQIRDITDIGEIDEAIAQKQITEAEIQKAIWEMRGI